MPLHTLKRIPKTYIKKLVHKYYSIRVPYMKLVHSYWWFSLHYLVWYLIIFIRFLVICPFGKEVFHQFWYKQYIALPRGQVRKVSLRHLNQHLGSLRKESIAYFSNCSINNLVTTGLTKRSWTTQFLLLLLQGNKAVWEIQGLQ